MSKRYVISKRDLEEATARGLEAMGLIPAGSVGRTAGLEVVANGAVLEVMDVEGALPPEALPPVASNEEIAKALGKVPTKVPNDGPDAEKVKGALRLVQEKTLGIAAIRKLTPTQRRQALRWANKAKKEGLEAAGPCPAFLVPPSELPTPASSAAALEGSTVSPKRRRGTPVEAPAPARDPFFDADDEDEASTDGSSAN